VAHANFHIATGIAVGTAITLIPLARAWASGRPLARPVGRLLLASYGLGFWAVMPGFLTKLGAPNSVHDAWWSNVFVLHSFINAHYGGGLLIGELAIGAAFIGHYLLVVLALRRARALARAHRGRSAPGTM